MIRNHPNWLFAGVFYDVESGLRRSGRTGLDKMLRKAATGKIDYIITKSISRISRDTLEVDNIHVSDTYILIFRTDGSQDKRPFRNC
ncbi:MAG: recombinase family protein, partial [Clostridia bacterium]|nr:recombinase family protein [Clostridia bacterium]